jgi:predicted SnoaL-like aldol condensation-catalyzing enzyme
MGTEDRKHAAVNFLRFAREGNPAAAGQFAAPGARQHNPHLQAGMRALLDAISAAAEATPRRASDVKRVLADGDYVVVPSQVRNGPGVPGAVVHILRFDGQPIPADNSNIDGMF